ncbi:secreted aspartic proteinase [Metarhizium rileyi]|uniref:Secreted aspartic proteinase n=1 Tax=Metarhizium rileyi (strain RCEF 4871) TaxID=1649241 RepID=A0A166XK41_METRR|nr:secreted aspartic proteinase [Metarhizium rileyi RCEF 4871]
MILSSLLFLLVACKSLAVPTEKQNSTAPAGILQLPLFNVPGEPGTNETVDTAFNRRQVSTGLDIFSGKTWGFLGTVVEIGTPPQRVILEPDTASRFLWVPMLPFGRQRAGSESVYFDSISSSSLQDLGRTLTLKYSAESVIAEGHVEKVSIEGQAVGKMIVGLVDLRRPQNKLGRIIGVLPLKPSSIGGNEVFLPKKLLNEGITRSTAFGLCAREQGRGALTFGGYDTSKFSGPLEKLPMVPGLDHTSFFIQQVSFRTGAAPGTVVIDRQSNQGNPVDMGVDSGNPVLYLPTRLERDFAAKTGSTVQDTFLEIDCRVVDNGAAFDFHITNNLVVSIPLSDYVHERKNNGNTCQLAITFRKPPANCSVPPFSLLPRVV